MRYRGKVLRILLRLNPQLCRLRETIRTATEFLQQHCNFQPQTTPLSPSPFTSTLPGVEDAATATIEPSLSSYPSECRAPSSNYERIEVTGHQLNQRTFEMLQYADTLFTGNLQITGNAITQAFYNSAVQKVLGRMLAVVQWICPSCHLRLTKSKRIRSNHSFVPSGWQVLPHGFVILTHSTRFFLSTYTLIAIGGRSFLSLPEEQLAGRHGDFWG